MPRRVFPWGWLSATSANERYTCPGHACGRGTRRRNTVALPGFRGTRAASPAGTSGRCVQRCVGRWRRYARSSGVRPKRVSGGSATSRAPPGWPPSWRRCCRSSVIPAPDQRSRAGGTRLPCPGALQPPQSTSAPQGLPWQPPGRDVAPGALRAARDARWGWRC